MKRSFAGILAASALVASFALAPAANAADASIVGTGSSYDNAIFTACVDAAPGIKLTYSKPGSGTGRSSFANKTVDFGAMDWLYTAADSVRPTFKYTYVPVIAGPIVVAYNVPGLNLKLDATTLSDVLQGKITSWDDAAIAKINKGAKLPSQKIVVVYRSTTSGTTQNLAAYMRDLLPNAGWKDSAAFLTASGNTTATTSAADNATLIKTVKSTAYSIGYADLADTLTAGVQAAAIKNGAGAYVAPTVASTAKFIAAQSMATTGQVRFDYETPVKGGYNLSLVSYVAAPTAAGTPAAANVKTWLTAYLSTCAPAKAAELGYVPLSGAFKATALKLAAKIG
jgi:phosphate transport system substrate-binding protein